MKFEEVDIAVEKPEYRGWFNMTGECLPRAMGRAFFDGKDFDLVVSDYSFNDLLRDKIKVYWLRGMP